MRYLLWFMLGSFALAGTYLILSGLPGFGLWPFPAAC